MYRILTIVLFLYSATGSDVPQFRADYKYSEKAGGWLKFHQVPATWQDARLRCHAEGAVLASPLNAELQDAMIEVVTSGNQAEYHGIYSGIHATFSNGDYVSVEGIPLSEMPIFWALDQPDNKDNNENCLIFYYNGSMADVQCSNTYKYLCYKKVAPMVISPCGTVDDQYQFDARTGSCYKFHRMGQVWSRAYMTCAAEGGHLAIINSDAEAEVLKDIFAKYPRHTLRSPYKDSAVIGFQDWGEHGTWFTVHGTTLEEAGYAKWSNTQPDNAPRAGVGQYCGAIFRTGLLDDIWCNTLVAFICEKAPSRQGGDSH